MNKLNKGRRAFIRWEHRQFATRYICLLFTRPIGVELGSLELWVFALFYDK